MLKLTLPLPPSTNNLYANGKRGRFKTKKYDAWLSEAYLCAMKLRPSSVHGPYRVSIQVPWGMRGDIDNRIKPIMDFLVHYGLTDDDRHCQGITIKRDGFLVDVCEVEAIPCLETIRA
jgi:Holliday junction resolvase RusA-like endonuclease